MINFDGDRSKKRRWFANKQIRLLDMLGLGSKSVKYDGFSISAWKQGDLSGGRITAPAGIMVLCSSYSGIQAAVADYWGGAITSLVDLYAIGYSPDSDEKPALRWFWFPDEDDFLEAGFDTFKYTPIVAESPFGVSDTLLDEPVYVTLDTDTYENLPCIPRIYPYATSEALLLSLADQVDYPDANPAEGYEYAKYLNEDSLLFYSSDNSNSSGRFGFVMHTDYRWYIWSESFYKTLKRHLTHTSQRISSNKTTRIYNSVSYSPSLWDYNVAVRWDLYNTDESEDADSDSFEPVYDRVTLADLIPEDMLSEDLRELYVNMYSTSDAIYTCAPAGTYCFELNGVEYTLHAVCSVTDHSQAYPSELGTYFEANPDDSKYCMFYIFKIGDETTIVNSLNFLSLLDSFSDYDLVTDTTQVAPDYEYEPLGWRRATEVLRYILMVPPIHHNSVFPYDSWVFHTAQGTVCAWSRRLGAFIFSTTGLSSESDFYLPSETGTDGVRPQISYAGTYDDYETYGYEFEDLYLCICDNIGEEIEAIYYGTPFEEDSWFALPPLDSEDAVLLSVRPIRVAFSGIQLMGISKDLDDDDIERYYINYLYYADSLEEEEKVWQRLSQLPFEVTDEAQFSLSLFGNEQAVNDMADYPTPECAHGQVPVGPYNLYNSEL